MRQTAAACMVFLVLVVVVAVRFGCRDSPSAAPAQPLVDAAIADAPVDGALVVPDAAPAPKKPAPPRTPKKKPAPAEPGPTPKPNPVVPTPAVPTPVTPAPTVPTGARPRCTHPPNPAGCPAKEPNVNRPCDAEGVHCVYGTSCCPYIYVCKGGAFEAWFQSCP